MTLAVAGSTLLVGFQLSLLVGFMDASAILVRRSGADIWIVPKGVLAIELSDRIDIGTLDIARSDPGIAEAHDLVIGMAPLRTEHGKRISVTLVGLPRGARSALPSPQAGSAIPGEEGVYDQTHVGLLGAQASERLSEIREIPFRLTAAVLSLPSFLGTPHVFVRSEAARAALGVESRDTSYVLAWLAPGATVPAVIERLSPRLEHAEAMSAEALSQRVASFWLLQTGAGGGFLLAALLGLIIGALIVGQLLWINVLESRAAVAALLAFGTPARALRSALSIQGFCIGMLGGVTGMLLVLPTIHLTARGLVPWIGRPSGLLVLTVLGAGLVGWTAAQLPAARAIRVDPALALRS